MFETELYPTARQREAHLPRPLCKLTRLRDLCRPDIFVDIAHSMMPETFEFLSRRFILSLFYIELGRSLSFYSPVEIYTVNVRCRVPPGPALMDLMMRLRASNSSLYYGVVGQGYSETRLSMVMLMDRCRAGQAFFVILTIEAMSLDSRIDVGVSSADSKEPVSNCPYRIGQLVRDQGLDCVFGRPGRPRAAKIAESRAKTSGTTKVLQEIRALSDTLKKIEVIS